MEVSDHTADSRSADLAHHVMPAGLDCATWGMMKSGRLTALHVHKVKLRKSAYYVELRTELVLIETIQMHSLGEFIGLTAHKRRD